MYGPNQNSSLGGTPAPYTPGWGTPANPYKGAAQPHWNPLGLLGGAAGLGLLWFLSRDQQKKTSEGSALQNNFTPGIWINNPPPVPTDGLGGAKDRLTNFYTGTSNRPNPWGAIPYLCGDMRMYMSVAANPYTYLQGSDQYVTGILTAGFGPVTMTNLKIGADSTYTGFTHEYLSGSSDNEPITYYTKDIEEIQVAKQLLSNVDVIELVPQECDQISIDIQFDNGHQNNHAYINTATGEVKYVKEALTTSFLIAYRVLGTAPWTVWNSSYNITGNTPNTYRNNATINVTRNRYEVKVTRLTADSTTPDIVDQSSFAALRGIRNVAPLNRFYTEKGTQVRLAYLAYKAKATQKNNGVLSEVNALMSRQVPVWNGSTWVMTDTANPAWYFVDILTGTAFGETVSKNDIDLDSIVAWANYCDTKGWKVNHVIDSETEIQEALKIICKTGRANWYMKDGKYSIVYDDVRANLIQHFTESNSREYIGSKAFPVIPNALAVRFLNEKNDYKSDLRIVYWDGFNENSTNLVVEEVDMPGTTDPDLVYKHARYELAAMRLRPETASVVTDLQHLVCNIGDKVRLCNKAGLLGLGSGIVTAVTTNGGGDVLSMTLNNTFTMSAGTIYEVEIRLADGTFMTRTVKTVDGETDTLEFLTPVPAATNPKPAKGDSVAFGTAGNIGMLMLVSDIEHMEDFEARVSMVPYSPDIFKADTETVPAYQPNISIDHESQWILPAPTFWTIRSDDGILLRRSDGSLESRIVVALAPPTDIRITHYQYEYKLTSDASWIPGGSVTIEKGQVVIDNVEDGQSYTIRIRHYAEPGKASDWLELTPYTVIGQLAPPPDVISIMRSPGTDLLQAGFEYLPADFAGFRWFYHIGSNRNRATALSLATLSLSPFVNISGLPRTALTIGCVMVDAGGRESSNPVWALVDLTDIGTENIVETIPLHPAFAGTHNGVIIANELHATDNGALMWSSNETTLMYSADPAALFWTSTYNDLIWSFNFTPSMAYGGREFMLLMRHMQELLLTAPQGYTLEFRRTGSGAIWTPGGDLYVFWDADDNILFWDSHEDAWLPWSGQLTGRVEPLDFRLTAFGGAQEPVVQAATFIIDLPDLREDVEDAVIGVGPTLVPLVQSFTLVTHCIVTLQYSGAYPNAFTYRVTDKNAVGGVMVEVLDQAGAPTGGIVDVTVRGY